jgi:zeaxanthin glucosyltransferase
MSESKGSIFLLLCPEQSSFNASFSLARGLRECGYRMVYAAPLEWKEFLLKQGFDFHEVEPLRLPETLNDEKRPEGRWRRFLFQRRQLQAVFAQIEVQLEEARQSLLREGPVLLLIDPLIKHQSLLPLLCKIPTIALNTTIASTFDSRIPSAFGILQPAERPRLCDRLRFTRDWARCLWRAWSQRFFEDKLVPLAFGLAPRSSLVKRVKRLGGGVRWGEYGPCLTVPEFVLSAKEIDLPQTIASRPRIYAGSSVDLLRDDGEYDFSWLQEDKPLVYCSLGTYSQWFRNGRGVFDAVIEALRLRDDLQAIVQVGNVAELDSFGELPERIRLVKRVPQLKVLERADIFITHAGFSSTREACYFGVPVIVFPYCNDGPGNSTRLVYHGMGVLGEFAKASTETVLQLLKEVQRDQYRTAAKRMQVYFKQQADCQAGLDFIERFLAEDASLQSQEQRSAWTTQFQVLPSA